MILNENSGWKQLTLPFNEDVRDALAQQHHAAQYIAMAGHHLIPQQPDDSNTNMAYFPDKEWLAGNELPGGLRIALHLSDLKLLLIDKKQSSFGEVPLSGKTKNQVFEALKQLLDNSKIDVSNFIDELHYEVPIHKLDKGAPFSESNKEAFQENTLYRHNAEIVLNKIATQFKDADPVRVWPHHFDTGSYTPVAYNPEGGISKSIGLGWAIPDSMVNEPYYYLSFWSESPVGDFKELPSPEAGEWIRSGWNGGVVKQSDILKLSSSKLQQDFVESFFQSGINILFGHYKL